jgi:hypothetical protein
MSQEGTMPKKETEEFPSFDDWEAPFDPEEVDGDKALRLIYSIRKDEHKLKTKLKAKTEEAEELSQAVTVYKEAEEAAKREGETETEALKRQVEALNKKLEEKPEEGDNLEAARLRIALKHGLTERQANRLVGEDVDELEEDAEALIEELGLNSDDDETDDKAGDDENEDAVKLRRRPQGRTPLDPKPNAGKDIDVIKDIDKLVPRG